MIIPVNPDWRINSDRYCWTVQSRSTVLEGENKGKVVWKNESYHTDLSQALTSLFDRRLRLSDADTLEKCIFEARRIADELQAAFTFEAAA